MGNEEEITKYGKPRRNNQISETQGNYQILKANNSLPPINVLRHSITAPHVHPHLLREQKHMMKLTRRDNNNIPQDIINNMITIVRSKNKLLYVYT